MPGKQLVPAPQAADFDDYQLDLQYQQQEQQLQFIQSERRQQAQQYEPGTYQHEGFTINSSTISNNRAAGDAERWAIKKGDFIAVNVRMRPEESGDVGAPSIARVLAILEDSKGHCWVALHYFWRWGQIHASADVAGREHGLLRPLAPRWSAELFLQQEELLDSDRHGRNAVFEADGTYRDLLSAADIEGPVKVLTYQQVLQEYPHLSEEQALQQYEADYAGDAAAGARMDGFWWRYTFDHTSYSFVADPAAFGGDSQPRRLDPASTTMADFFCGPGHCAVAARSAGWSVKFGVDSDGEAISSFAANTMHFPDEPFNPGTHDPHDPANKAQELHCTVEEFEAGVRAGRLDCGSVGYMHFSPPCQELSTYKREKLRKFTGATFSAIVRIVELCQPAFVTLEEVPGFIQHQFLKEGLLVWQELAKQQQQRRRQQQQSSQAFAASADATEASNNGCPPTGDEGSGVEEEYEEEEGIPFMQEQQQQQEQQEQPGANRVKFKPFLLVVPQLLSMGYQVRMCLLHSTHYGLPQTRWRVILFAAKIGYQLPMPPAPRYEPSPRFKAVLANSSKELDPDLIVNGNAARWFDLLTAAVNSRLPADGQLLPYVTVGDAIGDLPPIIRSRDSPLMQHSQQHNSTRGTSCHTPAGGRGGGAGAAAAAASISGAAGGSCSSSSTTHLHAQDPAAAAAAGAAGDRQPARGALRQQLASMRRQALEVAQLPHGKGHTYGRHCVTYEPAQGVLLCQLPPPVADLHPVSAFAQFCRTKHWEGQGQRDYNRWALRDHTCTGATISLPTDKDIMDPCGTVNTIVCSAQSKCSHVHFAEPRKATLAERRRFQGVPDWLRYEGSLNSQHRQVGNAVPYLMAAEIAASVFEAATGVDGRRPPPLVGPSPDGVGIATADMPRYRAWFDGPPGASASAAAAHWAQVVLSSQEAMREQLRPAAAESGGTGRKRSRSATASDGQ